MIRKLEFALIHLLLFLEKLVEALGQGNDTLMRAALTRRLARCPWPQLLGPLLLHLLYGMVDGFLGFLTRALSTMQCFASVMISKYSQLTLRGISDV